MDSVQEKIWSNLKQGSLLKNGSKAVKNRVLRSLQHSNLLYFLDPERVLTKKYCKDLETGYFALRRMGNYFVDKRIPLNKDSVVYSLGILRHITFDEAIVREFGCQVHMYDPSPVSAEFMESGNHSELFKFNPFAIWTERKKLKFYEPKLGGSPSAVFQFSDTYFEAEAYTIKEAMAMNNHTSIDVFKADIEGAALPIVEQMIEENILPNQIIVEFERPRNNMEEVEAFFERITKMRNTLRELNFEERLLPRTVGKYFSLEFLFVKRSAFSVLAK